MYLHNRPEGVIDYELLSGLTENYSSSDIRNLVDEAARAALRENMSIDTRHLQEAIQRNPSSLSNEKLSVYQAFQQRGI